MDNIKTDRLSMRKFKLSDTDAVFHLMTNDKVSKYAAFKDTVKTKEDAERVIAEVWFADYEKDGYGRLALTEKSKDKIIGFCGLKYLEDFKLTDLGYVMLPEYWGQGYATESSRACLEYGKALLNIKKFMALTHPENSGSQNVLNKLGFVETSRVKIDEKYFLFHEILYS